jgi:MFS transporter, ACS family, tartrate transporter
MRWCKAPLSFYAVRFLLGVAEAGFFPGMLLYLTYWFPRTYLARVTANFMVAVPLSAVIGGPLSSIILGMDGVARLHGWQWLFLIEGVPVFLLSFAVLKLLPDGPARAPWLSVGEKELIIKYLAAVEPPGRPDLWRALYDARLVALSLANFAFQASAYGVALWLPQIVQGMGFSNRDTGFVVALPYVASLGVMVICGRSSSKRGERTWHVAIPWLLAASGFAVASLVQSDAIVLAAVSFGLLIMFAAYGPFYSWPSSFLRGTAAAGGIGIFNTIGSLGGFFGPTLFGALREGTGDYATGLAAAAFGFVLATLIVLAVGRVMAARPTIVIPEMDSAG